MTQTDIDRRENPTGGLADDCNEISSQCGKPLYNCPCRERWEDEGGAVVPEPEIAA